MLAIAVWLVVLGGCDLLRAGRDATTPVRRANIAAVGVLALVLGGLAVDMSAVEWAWLFPAWVAGFLLWLFGSSIALQGGGHGLARAAAFCGLALGLGVGILRGGEMRGDWPDALEASVLTSLPPDRVALVVGVLLVQLATANVAVRLVLDAVGVPATTNEKKLKGGRLLGPMERVFIVGLALAGQVTAAAIVVAAKGLLRFPELQRETEGPSDVTEYFLIGSFASWLVALGGVFLASLPS